MVKRQKGRGGERIEPRFETPGRAARGGLKADSRDRVVAASGRKAKRKPSSARRTPPRRWLARLAYWGIVAGIWGFIALTGFIAYYAAGLPSISNLQVPKRAPNVVMVSANGNVLASRGIGHGKDVRISELPPYLPQAIVAIEDRRFRSHFGIDPIGLTRAFARNILAGRVVEGGSTLTQQLAKNLFLDPDRTLRRKVQEMILAIWLEANYSKDQILEIYLNRVYFGAGTYGVEAAARRFFGKGARQVTLAEAAILAGLLKAPSRYAPTKNPDLAEDRAQLVIQAMVQQGYVTEPEGLTAIAHPGRLVRQDAPGAIGYVADWISDQLPGFIGQPDSDIIVETTIDPRLQAAAETALADTLGEQGGSVDAGQGALVALDRGGAVKALVGGRAYADSQFNRAVKAQRQPGSAFKPFIYLAALEDGLTPDTIRDDAPVRFGKWTPKNYNDKYRGPVTLREALAFSYNTVAARLAAEVGVKRIVATARRLGIASPLGKDLSLALGTSEVTLLEMTGAYVPFANGGYGVLPFVIRRVKTSDGNLLYERAGSGPGRVIGSLQVGQMNDMLREALQTGTARRAALGNWPAAGKTGTTQDWRDAWFVGYTADLTAGVWVGNDDGVPMKRVSGGSLPAEIWHRFMNVAHEGRPPLPLPGKFWRNPDLEPPVASIGADPAAPLPPYARPDGDSGGGFRINADFLKRIFGG